MQIPSFVYQNGQWRRVQVHTQLIPGPPGITVIGLPDRTLKESVWRIKSALYAQGYELPVSQQVVVDLKPSLLPKSNSGLELAIAASILWCTGQQRVPPSPQETVIFGQLGLDGRIHLPDFMESEMPLHPKEILLTGKTNRAFGFRTLQAGDLKSIVRASTADAQKVEPEWCRPELPDWQLSKQQAEILSVLALGEHATLLAGPPGTGKSTLAQCVLSLLSEPNWTLLRQAKRYGVSASHWRPIVQPHHSAPAAAILGGGQPIRPGALTRAHGGVLLLDEYFEFSPQIQEALREPLEQGAVHLYRGAHFDVLPARILLVATTNLCHCGAWIPQRYQSPKLPRCRCTSTRLESFQRRVRGPSLDRFAMFSYLTEKPLSSADLVSLPEILDQLQSARQWRHSQGRGDVLNSRIPWQTLPAQLTRLAREFWQLDVPTARRRAAWIQVARTVADLAQSEKIDLVHLQKAQEWTVSSFQDWF